MRLSPLRAYLISLWNLWRCWSGRHGNGVCFCHLCLLRLFGLAQWDTLWGISRCQCDLWRPRVPLEQDMCTHTCTRACILVNAHWWHTGDTRWSLLELWHLPWCTARWLVHDANVIMRISLCSCSWGNFVVSRVNYQDERSPNRDCLTATTYWPFHKFTHEYNLSYLT